MNNAPLWAPQPGATFGQAVNRFFKKYATFSGRASQSEFWWVVLMNILVNLGLWILVGIGFLTSGQTVVLEDGQEWISAVSASWLVMFGYFLWVVWGLATLIPMLALASRRLHDVNMSSWWLLLLLTGIGTIFIVIVALIPSNPAGVRFDRPPYGYVPPQQFGGPQPY